MGYFLLFRKWYLFAFILLVKHFSLAQKVTRYDLYVRDTLVNYTGKNRPAFCVNGSIPMPELHFTEGDTAEIWVHNELSVSTSFHWHGLILPNPQDGVPYLTSAPVAPGETHIYRFPLVQHGTFWYHSHAMLQEQSGLYGAFIIHEKGNKSSIPELTLVLSDWTDMKPSEVERRLHTANDWSSIKKAKKQKGAVQSYADAIVAHHLGTKLGNEWKRMQAMDVSDIYYNEFHVNGKRELVPALPPGSKVRVRIINGSSSTYFWIRWSGGKLSVVASDGADVVPVEVDRFIIGVSETYDVILTIPDNRFQYELQATSEDRLGSASVWIGEGERKSLDSLKPLKFFEGMNMMNNMMEMSGNIKKSGMPMSLQKMDMNRVMYPEIVTGMPMQMPNDTVSMNEHQMSHNHRESGMQKMQGSEIVTLNYGMLKSPVNTSLPEAPTTTYHFELNGNMSRYVWTINNKTVSENDRILIKQGQNVRIIIYNNSMMRHPMHLHGHYFRVINDQGAFSPLKNVIDVKPMETDTIEFAATENGDWFFHCHILYHMMSGMGRIFSYENSPPNPQLPDKQKALQKLYQDDRRYYFTFQNDFATNGNDGEMAFLNTRWKIQTEWRLGYNDRSGYESESHVGRYFGKMQWAFVYTGFDWRYRKSSGSEKNLFGQISTKDEREVACIGIQYTLPFLIIADFRVDSQGKLRLQFQRQDLALTKRLRLDLMYNSDLEYMVGLKYILDKMFAISAHYDSDMGIGAGITLLY